MTRTVLTDAQWRWLRAQELRWQWVLAAIALITVVFGAFQFVAPGVELRLLRAEDTATSRHFFRIVGMFMVLFGGLLLHGLRDRSKSPVPFLWAGLQKVGASVMVAVGVVLGLMSPVAMLVAVFDLLSAVLVLGYVGFLRHPARLGMTGRPERPVGQARPPEPELHLPPPAVAAQDGRKRSVILAGGGMRVAWQAGVLRALSDAGLTFQHADGTSGGILNLAMMLSGQSPREMCDRWRTLQVRDFVSFVSPEKYLRAWNLEALGDADGIVDRVFPHLGIDVDAIHAQTGMEGTFNVCNFSRKTNEVFDHTRVDRDLLVAGISLPIFMPPVDRDGTLYTDSVWIQDANLLEAVRRGADELWVVWCIGNTPTYEKGVFHQYVHMIELSANGALFEQLEQIRQLNARILAGEEVLGHRKPIAIHLVKPERPLPLDPDFYAGHITAGSLIDMGYSDAWRYLSVAGEQGLPLTPEITQMTEPAPDLTFRETMSGPLALGATDPVAGAHQGKDTPFTMHCTISVDDMDAFVRDATHSARLVAHVSYPPFGEDIPVRQGSFNLFRSGDDPRTKLMTYGLRFEAGGKEYYLEGSKTIHDDKGPDLWKDTTRLYSQLHEGGDARGPVVGAGVLKLGVGELLKLIGSMRSAREGTEGVGAIARFGRFFLGTLWDIYSPRAEKTREAEEGTATRV